MFTKTIERLNVPGPRAREILARDKKVISQAYGRVADLVMSHGEGCYVYDVDGNRFLDWASGIAVNSTGHSHPRVVQAIQEQASRFLHISSDFYHPAWVELCEKLDEIAPFQEEAQTFLGNSGTEAVEGAIKLAQYATGRSRFIGFLGGFHGRTLGSLGFTASKTVQRAGFNTLPYVTHVPFPNSYRPLLMPFPGDEDAGDTVVSYIEKVLFKGLVPPQDVAAVLVEPIQGEGGYLVPPKNFFPRLRELCDRYGILLIADEVQTGVGRTGRWWAVEHWGVEPDIVATAKGIASGMPLGGFIARRSIMEKMPTSAHGNTYGGNPLACVAALATLAVLEEGGMANAETQGDYMMDAFSEMEARHPSIGDVRGKGLMIGVEFVQDKKTKAEAPKLRNRVAEIAFEHGLVIMGCGSSAMRIIPPLVINRDEVDEGLAIFEHAVTQAENELL